MVKAKTIVNKQIKEWRRVPKQQRPMVIYAHVAGKTVNITDKVNRRAA